MKASRFTLLSYSWGLPLTVCGLLAAVTLTAAGYRPTHYYGAWLFRVGYPWGGLSLGPVLIVSEDASDRLCRHELGHAIQNCRYGPMILPLVMLSVLRYHWRQRRIHCGLPLTPYDSWRFEGEATRLGTAAVAAYRQKEERP